MLKATHVPVATARPALRLLIVEGSPLGASRIERCIRAWSDDGVSVAIVADLGDVSEVLRRDGTDAVLLGDGLRHDAVLAWLRDEGRSLPVPVILFCEDNTRVGESALLAGAADALPLPVSDPRLLQRAIRNARTRMHVPVPARDEGLRQSLKLEAIGRLAGGVAHDFSNLLTIMIGASERMLEELPAGTRLHGEADLIRASCERGAALTRQLLAFSRRQPIAPRAIDLRPVVTASSRLLSPLVGEHIFLVVEAAPDVWPVAADPGQFEQVVMNLVLNARDAMPHGGPLTLRLRNARVDEPGASASHGPQGEYVLFEVVDSGVGMSADTMARAFEPFFTTKEEHKGTGLGLATVHDIVRELGGHVRLDSAVGRGTTVGVYLPRCIGEAVEASQPDRPDLPPRGTETVLLTEDEAAIRDLLQTILERHGYTVIVATGAPGAIALAESWNGSIDLLVSDVVMPGGTGPELAKRLRRSRPGMRVLYISGYPGSDGPGEIPADGASFLPKPFTRQTLLQTVREVLDLRRPPGHRGSPPSP